MEIGYIDTLERLHCNVSGRNDSVLSRQPRPIEDKKKQLAVIEEYKKSLIFEYVTGKKEVPIA